MLAALPRNQVDDETDSVIVDLSLARAFDALSEADQEVLRLAVWEELPARQAAAILGCTAATFHVRLHRARTRLRNHLSPAQRAPQTSLGRADA